MHIYTYTYSTLYIESDIYKMHHSLPSPPPPGPPLDRLRPAHLKKFVSLGTPQLCNDQRKITHK